MMFDRLFRPKATRAVGERLYHAAVAQARWRSLYADLGVPDTNEGRFELYSLHVYLLLERLKGRGEQATDTAQALFDTYVKGLDHALREMGVGDLSVGKKMRRLGEAFFGRVKAYESAFERLPATSELEALLQRTAYAEAAVDAAPLAAYVLAQRQRLADQPLEALLNGDVTWSGG